MCCHVEVHRVTAWRETGCKMVSNAVKRRHIILTLLTTFRDVFCYLSSLLRFFILHFLFHFTSHFTLSSDNESNPGYDYPCF